MHCYAIENSEKYKDSCYKQYAQCAITLNCGLLTFGFFYISSQDSGCLALAEFYITVRLMNLIN